MALDIAREDPRQREVVAMIGELDRLMQALYPAESNHLLDPASLARPDTEFLVARERGRALGCGAFRKLDARHGEIKRMWVSPSERGKGIGRRILAELERRARAAGVVRMSLETGISQPEAIGLYRAQGYADCAAFADYAPDPLSIFMSKEIA